MKIWIIIGIISVGVGTGLFFIAAQENITSETILETNTSIIGQKIEYPSGEPLITSSVVTIPKGAETGFHVHEHPMYAFILDGEITVDYGEEGIKTYTKGDSFIEAIQYEHNGKNTGEDFAKILVVLIGQK